MKTFIRFIHATMFTCLTLASASVLAANEGADKTHGALSAVNPDAIEGKDVLDNTGNQLGDVDEVVKSKNGEHMAVIGLEDSIKEVAVPLNELKMSADGGALITMLNRSDLEALPDYDPMQLESVDE